MFESYAQNLEDVVLWRVLGHVDQGTYVDVGAADPEEHSVTKAFYERGWSGLNVEPADDYAERLRTARPRDLTIQVCAGEAEGTATFHHVLGTGLSSLVESSIDALAATSYEVVDVQAPMQRLDALLAEVGFGGREIHFLKIDVEGFEESVLRGIDLSIWRPWVIVAEATKPNSTEQVHERWEPLLLENGYEFCLFDGLNCFYLAREHPELRANLSYPACVFDRPYSTPFNATLLGELNRTLSAHKELDSEYQRTLSAYQELEREYQRTLSAYTDLEREYLSVVAKFDQVSSLHEGAREALQSATSELVIVRDSAHALAVERDALADDLERWRQRSDDLDQVVTAMRRTVSWRLTRPLRGVRRLMR